jgi:NAD(P)-dependent dehydrogenase (short-subunit alcohol dehydrogenase family)
MGALDGQVAVVTGGESALGRAIADAYSQEGAAVVVSADDGAPFDTSTKDAVEALLDRAVDEHGSLDVVVLNAGAVKDGDPVASLSDDDWQRVLDLHLNQVFWGIRRSLHHLLPRGRGRIVVTSTVEGKLPRPGAAAYAAAKHGVNGLVKSVAGEVGTQGIAINALLAGSTDQPHALSKLGRGNTTEEVAKVAVLLASPSVTSITGCMFPVDGGTMPY